MAAAAALKRAHRPVIIAGRGAVLADAAAELEKLAEMTGALLATSAPANGLFAGLPYALGISGGFATPLASRLLPQADVVLAVGASLNHWTTKHGELIGPDTTVIQIDTDARAIARHRPADHGLLHSTARSLTTPRAKAQAAKSGSGPRVRSARPLGSSQSSWRPSAVSSSR
jgi:thiamine pyrophosphate-dependent acetolactate synthase large subunit-like protein